MDAHHKRNGRFILLGSISPALMRRVGQSLAGRMAVLDLTPVHLDEVDDLPLARLAHPGNCGSLSR